MRNYTFEHKPNLWFTWSKEIFKFNRELDSVYDWIHLYFPKYWIINDDSNIRENNIKRAVLHNKTSEDAKDGYINETLVSAINEENETYYNNGAWNVYNLRYHEGITAFGDKQVRLNPNDSTLPLKDGSTIFSITQTIRKNVPKTLKDFMIVSAVKASYYVPYFDTVSKKLIFRFDEDAEEKYGKHNDFIPILFGARYILKSTENDITGLRNRGNNENIIFQNNDNNSIYTYSEINNTTIIRALWDGFQNLHHNEYVKIGNNYQEIIIDEDIKAGISNVDNRAVPYYTINTKNENKTSIEAVKISII